MGGSGRARVSVCARGRESAEKKAQQESVRVKPLQPSERKSFSVFNRFISAAMHVDFEKLRMSGTGKAIAVLTSGGDAQGEIKIRSHEVESATFSLLFIYIF